KSGCHPRGGGTSERGEKVPVRLCCSGARYQFRNSRAAFGCGAALKIAAATKNRGVASSRESRSSIGLPCALSRGVVEVESKVASIVPAAISFETVAWPLLTNFGFCVMYFV